MSGEIAGEQGRSVHVIMDEFRDDLQTGHPGDSITLQAITDRFGKRSFGFLLMVFCAPAALPIPALGLAQILALPLLFFSLQMTLARPSPWLPGWIGRRSIQRKKLIAILETLSGWLRKVEYLIKPRLLFVTGHWGEKIIGLFCLACSISVAMPFPFSNTVPSMGILLMSLGLLERDGLIVKGGMLVGAAGVTLAILVMVLGVEAVRQLFSG